MELPDGLNTTLTFTRAPSREAASATAGSSDASATAAAEAAAAEAAAAEAAAAEAAALPPWSEAAARARGVIQLKARHVPAEMWPARPCSTNFAHYNDSCAGPAPESPVQLRGGKPAAVQVELLPFGALDVSMGELPWYSVGA